MATNHRPSLFGRTLRNVRGVWRDIAAAARLPFTGGVDPELPDDAALRLREQMRECLEARGGEVLARARAANIAQVYLGLSPAGRRRFLEILANDFAVERATVEGAIDAYRGADDLPATLAAEAELRGALVPPAVRLLTQLNAIPEGIKFLVDMRADLLPLARDHPRLEALDDGFRSLLATWFDVGFLSLRRVTWESPAALLEKIIAYEAVHEIRSWSDLRHRLHGDRRCYAFFHPSMPGEPLIFVEVALVGGMAGDVQELLEERRQPLDPAAADTAVFYSITNSQRGLRGISFGSFLIKRVVDDLARDLPNLRQFATLSPMPRFRTWLAGQDEVLTADERAALTHLLEERSGRNNGAPAVERRVRDRRAADRPATGAHPPDAADENGGANASEVGRAPRPPTPPAVAASAETPRDDALAAALAGEGWCRDEALTRLLDAPLKRAAARYLLERAGGGGEPIDPVARFHLGNGARIERINALADVSERGLRQSAGLMVNYLYDRDAIEDNHEAFAGRKVVTVSPEIMDLLKAAGNGGDPLVRVARRRSGLGRMIGRA